MPPARFVALGLAAAALAAAAPPSSAPAAPALSSFKTAAIPGATHRLARGGRRPPAPPHRGLRPHRGRVGSGAVARLAAHRRVIVFDNRGVATSTGLAGRLTIDADGRRHGAVDREAEARAPRRPRLVDGRLHRAGARAAPPEAGAPACPRGHRPGRAPVAVQPKRGGQRRPRGPRRQPGRRSSRSCSPPASRRRGRAWFAADRRASRGCSRASLTVSPGRRRADARLRPALDGPRQGHVVTASAARPAGSRRGRHRRRRVPPANSRLLARRIPGAQLRLFPDAGHAFLVQDGPAFARAVRRFLTRRNG